MAVERPVVVAAPARGILTCSLGLEALFPPSSAPVTAGVGLGPLPPSTTAMTAGKLASDVSLSAALLSAATRATLAFGAVGMHGAGGSVGVVSVTCRDGAGRRNNGR